MLGRGLSVLNFRDIRTQFKITDQSLFGEGSDLADEPRTQILKGRKTGFSCREDWKQ